MNDMVQDTLILGETIEQMRLLPDESVDVVFADPPYNLQLKKTLHRPDNSLVHGVTDDWDAFDSLQAYDEFCHAWLQEARRVLKRDGTIWVIGSYHNIYRLGAAMQDMNYWFLNDIIWVKANPMPNFKGRRFTNAHETVLWCAKSEQSRYTFNYEAMKALNDDVQMRSDWYLSLCTGHERLKDSMGKKIHPTQKPESLLYRIILASTNPGDIILDPFAGTATTCAMAKKMGRHYIGIERCATYYNHALKRLDKTKSPSHAMEIAITPPKRKEARVAFGQLVEEGYIKAGSTLVSHCQRFEAKVRADGSLVTERYNGSIHRVGAMIQGAISCNGWTYWHVKKGRKSVVIDDVRQEFRQKNAIAL